MSDWLKQAVAVGSGVPDLTAHANVSAPVPQIGIENKPAPGQTGPRGMHGRTTYSRVNTGTPPTPDAGAAAQKSQAPRGMESLKVAHVENTMTTNCMRQPSLQDLIKVAMDGAAEKLDLSLEAALQMANDGHRPSAETAKVAAAAPAIESVPTSLTTKLAGALYYVAKEMSPKLAAIDIASGTASGIGPGEGPGALTVGPARAEGDGVLEAGQSGKATPANQPPINPPMQKDPTRPGPANQLQTNDSMQHPEQPVEPISNEKAKLSSAYLSNLVACGLAKIAMALDGTVTVVPAEGVEKVALLGGAMGAAEAPTGHRVRGAMAGEGGTQLGGIAGGIGGGALGAGLGGVTGAGLGTAMGALSGGPVGALLGAGVGGVTGAGLGGAAGAVGGAMYGRQKGYNAMMAPYREISQLRQQAAAPAEAPMEVTASALYLKNLDVLGLQKAAEDAINPAQISAGRTQAGATLPEGVSPSEEGVPSEPSDVSAQKRQMIDSNEAAINYTKRDAKGDPKSDLRDVLHEPALSAQTDTVLNQAVAHNNEAGSKISSVLRALQQNAPSTDAPVSPVKMASARAVLAKLAEAACGKKEKKAQMGITPPPPTPTMTGAQAAKTNV